MNHSKRDIERRVRDLPDRGDGGETELRQRVPVELVGEWLQETDADPERYEWLQKVGTNQNESQ